MQQRKENMVSHRSKTEGVGDTPPCELFNNKNNNSNPLFGRTTRSNGHSYNFLFCINFL